MMISRAKAFPRETEGLRRPKNLHDVSFPSVAATPIAGAIDKAGESIMFSALATDRCESVERVAFGSAAFGWRVVILSLC